MANLAIAVLEGLSLPKQFSYGPYIPRKRVSTTATINDVVVQAADPHIVHGDVILQWSCQSCFAAEVQAIYDLYNNTSLVALTFLGYWGENYEVYFRTFDPPRVRGRLWDLSGQLQVVSVTTDFTPECSI